MEGITEFNSFLLKNTFNKFEISETESLIAFNEVVNDVIIHFNKHFSDSDIFSRITSNQPELAMYLYRLGRLIYLKEPNDIRISYLHGLMRSLCSCEIYFSTSIGEGFYLSHGLGTVIGSRNTIGRNFRIHQNCTIGHKKNGLGLKSGEGVLIGDNVVMYANSSIIGEITIGDNAVIGINKVVFNDIPSNTIVK